MYVKKISHIHVTPCLCYNTLYLHQYTQYETSHLSLPTLMITWKVWPWTLDNFWRNFLLLSEWLFVIWKKRSIKLIHTKGILTLITFNLNKINKLFLWIKNSNWNKKSFFHDCFKFKHLVVYISVIFFLFFILLIVIFFLFSTCQLASRQHDQISKLNCSFKILISK